MSGKYYVSKQVTRTATALSLGMLLLPGISNAADYPVPGDYQQGAKTWAENCGRCHNIRGPGDLRDDQWISTVYHMRVRAGLTGQEARDVLSFLQGSNKDSGRPVKTSAATAVSRTRLSGESVYNGTCVACHGADGTGAMPGVPDFSRPNGPLTKSTDTLVSHVVEGFRSPGSPMAMPPYGGNPNLTKKDINSVVAYIRKKFGK